MTDVVVTVPKGLWQQWINEGDLPGEQWSGLTSHFWIPQQPNPDIQPGERVYIVAHGKLRGYSPLIGTESFCRLNIHYPRACLQRRGNAVACTIPEPIRGFQGWRYRWWEREDEMPFLDWREP